MSSVRDDTRPDEQQFRRIIGELLAIDPSLGKDRAKLERMVDAMIAAKPADTWRPAFQQELLEKLRQEMKHEKTKAPSYLFSSFSMVHNALFAGGGAVFGALLIFALAQSGTLPVPAGDEASPGAFGSIAPERSFAPYGQGGGAGNPVMDKMSQGGGGDGTSDMMIYPPENYVQSRYTYDGAITLPTADIQVYLRNKPSNRPSAGSAGRGFAENMLNWGALSGLTVQSMQLTQGDDGYSVYIDHNEGMLSMNRTIDYASRPGANCTDEACFERNRLREGDMISNDEAIAIARSFAQRFGLDTSRYGDPVVTDNWQFRLAAVEDKSMFYFPEEIMVTFPLQIDGKPVYEEYGVPYGLNIGVDVREKMVNNVYNYSVLNLDNASYAPVTDEARVRDALYKGSLYSWEDPNAEIAEATVGAPVDGYMHYFLWDEKTFVSKELFVPALVFPVTDRPANFSDMRENIVVPLAADIYEKADQSIPMPRPMPLMEEEVPVDDGGAAGIFEEGQVPEDAEDLEVR